MVIMTPILSSMLAFFGVVTFRVRQRYVTCIVMIITLTSGCLGLLVSYVLIRDEVKMHNLYNTVCNTVVSKADNKTGMQLAKEQYFNFVDLVMCSSNCPCPLDEFRAGKWDKMRP